MVNYREFLTKVCLFIAVWIPEVIIAYLISTMPIWITGAILGLVFCIFYGFLAAILSYGILFS